jgi:hypothetical protein
MAFVAVLWAVTPAVACLLPTNQMTPAEQECCRKMAQPCGSSSMPSSHSCCQGHQRDTVVSPVSKYSSTRPVSVAILPQVAIHVVDATAISLLSPLSEAAPPELSPGSSSVLRI